MIKSEEKKLGTAAPLPPPPPAVLVNFDLFEIMDEVLTDSIEYLLQFSALASSLSQTASEEEMEELREREQVILLQLEEDICAIHGVDIKTYYDEVQRRDNAQDKEIQSRLDKLGKLIEDSVNGKPIVVDFTLSPELTKEKTLFLYKMLLISHLHIHYLSVSKYLKEHENATPEELQEVIDADEVEKRKRRNELAQKHKIVKTPSQDYRSVLQRAYYTYLTHDEDFKKQIQKLLFIHKRLVNKLINKELVAELKLDAFTMDPTLFNVYCSTLEKKYGPTA